MKAKDQLVGEVTDYLVAESYGTISALQSDQLASGWYYLRWYPSSLEEMESGNFGKVVDGMEASPCYPESEYFSKGNFRPITFWSSRVNQCWSTAESGLEWVECPREKARYLSCPEFSGYAVVGNPESFLELAEKCNLGKFADASHATDALVAAGATWFTLGTPVDGVDTSEIREAARHVVENFIEQFQPED